MIPSFDLDALVDAVAERVAAKIVDRLPTKSPSADDSLLLTIEQAACKLGRTVPASANSGQMMTNLLPFRNSQN
jgi:hypothetical protein